MPRSPGLGVVQTLLGRGVEGSHLAETLELPLARRYAARVLMQCTAAKVRGMTWGIEM